ncbi:toprim domain-containing protein [Lactobacillus sp. ESL0233]|uniref:toprim domain-containing protein n=1 Tax=Lactobacillus sp. ESL0233 TaxID=2069354 RepID=UPI001F37DC64|nr:toprim domain-containing protein [Lactobacillus sp. ESL0233]
MEEKATSAEANSISKFTKEQIRAANQASILDYAHERGIDLEQTGANSYRGVEHDSLVIIPSKNYFMWNSRGISGQGALSFALNYELADENLTKNIKFLTATKNVLESGASKGANFTIKREPFKFDTKELDPEGKINQVWAYMHHTRGISNRTINELHQNKMLEQDRKGSALFIWRDPKDKHKVLGVSKQGTYVNHKIFGKRGTLKQIEKNSTMGYGFYFDSPNMHGKTPENIRFFESPIDAISFFDLSKAKNPIGLQNTRFVAMNGLKESVFNTFIKTIADQLLKEGGQIKSIGLGVDNDAAGQNFAHKIQSKYPKVKYIKPSPKYGKDWNDVLKAYREIQNEAKKTLTKSRQPIKKTLIADPQAQEYARSQLMGRER